ncbi:MAG: NERD domain-containing protein [Anaerolineae bacterium]|nr:NERD domain-containing protein [Anaerolineae bacterium]
MARMYPQWISKSERENNPGRRAEYLVYDRLAEQLGDDWLVLYSQAIKWTHDHGVSDREADFIVAHPKLGVVMVEVKGGSIERKGGQWYSTPLGQLDRPKAHQKRIFSKWITLSSWAGQPNWMN